jgi:hypothetical protein
MYKPHTLFTAHLFSKRQQPPISMRIQKELGGTMEK